MTADALTGPDIDGEQRVAVVTGGAGAIGSSIVEALEAGGHRVVILDKDQVDLGDTDDVRRAAAEIDRCDVLVHAAAAFNGFTLANLDIDALRHVQTVNVESLLLLAQAFAPGMAQRGFGRIISIVSDTYYWPPTPNLLPYVSTKGALIGVTRVLAHELGGDGIAVTAVAPGLTATPGTRAAMPQAAFDNIVDRQALPRTLEPEDVAATVAFLATDGAAPMTGQTLVPDGGFMMR
jgi:NAD(P)-dependent dehydrogenase (short-subunit alcohol dehydrogenase family)